MDLKDTQANWNLLGAKDPLYGVLSHAGKQGGVWDEAEFFKTGVDEIGRVLDDAKARGLTFPRRQALDFGCAVGRLSQALALHFDEVTGVDIAPAMLERAERFNQFGPRCRYVLNTGSDLKLFENGRFDFIYSNIVLQHMAPRYALAYIAEFVRVLAPGGLLVFQVPERPQYGLWRRFLKSLLPGYVVHFYRRTRYGAGVVPEAEIEMNGVPEPEVLAALQAAGGKAVHHGGGWYWVQK
jgi:SAM-dependent methyltransferase